MSDNNVDKAPQQSKAKEFTNFLQEVKDFALTVNEDCPEGHRRDARSGRCLPMGSTDHTAFTRSLNVDYGPEWRGDEMKPADTVFADDQEEAVDAFDMEDLESCTEGTTFSFVQRKCVTLDEAELENADETPMDGEDAAAPGVGGHPEITQMQPEGRRDTVNHDCPPNQFFDYKNRMCIPLNKDTVMASENAEFTAEFKKAVAFFGKVAKTSPDPLEGHFHMVTVNEDGDGMTSVEIGGLVKSYAHAHEVVEFDVTPHEEPGTEYISRHPGPVNPMERDDDDVHADSIALPFGSEAEKKEEGAPITSKKRGSLPESSFGVPGKRKFPLDSCGRVRNAMARFNQAKGLSSGEKATLRRKILARAKTCGIEVQKFAKATSDAEFAEVLQDLMGTVKKDRLDIYRSEDAKMQGPCPPGMIWASESKRCTQTRGLVDSLKDEAQHVDIVNHQPEGRRDTVGFQCPDGWFFDFTNRRCLPLDPSMKPGSTTDKAEQRDLAPSPAGRPARLPVDCPPDTIWDKDLEICKPLDSRKKTKSEEDNAAGIPPQFLKNIKKKKDGKNGDDKKDDKKGGFPDFLKKKSKSEEDEDGAVHPTTTPSGPGKKGGPGCPEGQFMNPITKKCMPRKGAFKGKSENEIAENAQPQNREGLTSDPAGRVKHPTDCPPGTFWNTVRRTCVPLSSMDKNRPSGASPQPATNTAETDELSIHQLIKHLDSIIKEAGDKKEKSRVVAKDLPNAAFPPSLVSSTKRSLMHHATGVEDPYDHETVDVSRLRNALARSGKVEGFSDRAVEDALEHLLYHARVIVGNHLSKKD